MDVMAFGKVVRTVGSLGWQGKTGRGAIYAIWCPAGDAESSEGGLHDLAKPTDRLSTVKSKTREEKPPVAGVGEAGLEPRG
eukprot:1404997-Prymnesium_polylepis.2